MPALEAQHAGAIDSLGLVGETVAGRFLVERVVAEGGFGVVYRARQVGLDRAVALKVLKPPAAGDAGDAGAAFRQTFEAEARIIARLDHPNIVAVYDFGVSARASGGPLHWIALEWLEGRTLEALLQERRAEGAPPLDPSSALVLLRPVLECMALAHARGVAHRDLKPSNILLHEQAGRHVPKVLDFGIARMVAPDEEEKTTGAATTRAFPAFSPDYAAPEQVTHGRTGPRTDVHALGLMLTELLTGAPPYGDLSSPEAGEGRFELVISTQRPTPGSRGVGVGAWERVLARALSRRPGDRQPNAAVLLEELERDLPQAAPPARQPTTRNRWRIPRRLAAAVVLTVVAAAAGLTTWSGLRPAAPGRMMMAVLPFENLTGDPQQEYLADGLTDGMISHLGRVAPDQLAVIARTSITQYKGTKKGVKQIGGELGVSHLLESSVKRGDNRIRIDARLIQVSDETQIWADSYDREIKDVPALQSDIAQAIAAGIRIQLGDQRSAPRRTRSVKPEAYEAYLRGRYLVNSSYSNIKPEWRAYFEQAIQLDPSYAAPYAALAASYVYPPPGLAASEGRTRAKAAAFKAVELDPESPEAHAALAATLLHREWDWAGAERHFRRSLELDPNNAETLRVSSFHQSVGRFAEAIALRKRAIELSPMDARTIAGLGTLYITARQYDEAIVELRRSFAFEPNPGFGLGHMFLGIAYLRRGMYREALAEAEKCVAYAGSCLGRVTVWAQARSGQMGRALATIEQMKTIARTESVRASFFARAYAAVERPDEALAWLNRAYEDREADMVFLRVDPDWDLLRGDPRFEDLIRRVGIPPLSPG